MTQPSEFGPAQLVLLASVARRYYFDGRSKIEIADEFSLSRFKVARLLETARSGGLVRIEISYAGSIDVELSSRLQDAFGLRHAVVVDTSEQDDTSLRQHIGRAAADLLTEIVTADDVLGLGWARSLVPMAAALTRLAPCSVVQLSGAVSSPEIHHSPIDLVRTVARAAGSAAHYFYAPLIAPDATTAAALLRSPEVVRAASRFDTVTKAVIGVGGWRPPFSTVYESITPQERQELLVLGVCAEICGSVLLDPSGAVVRAPLTERVIGISADELRQVPEVIALAYNTVKVPAARAAMEGGFVTSLVTHTDFARCLLAGPAAAGGRVAHASADAEALGG